MTLRYNCDLFFSLERLEKLLFRNAQPGDRITFSQHVQKQIYFDTCEYNKSKKDFFATWVEKDLFCFRYQGKNKLYPHTGQKQFSYVELFRAWKVSFMHERSVHAWKWAWAGYDLTHILIPCMDINTCCSRFTWRWFMWTYISESRTRNGVTDHFEFLLHWHYSWKAAHTTWCIIAPHISYMHNIYLSIYHNIPIPITRFSNLVAKISFVDVGEIFGYFLP